jgi:hypothetical protein
MLPVISIKRAAISKPAQVITEKQASPVIFLEPVADRGHRLPPNARPCTAGAKPATQTAQSSDQTGVPSFVDFQKRSRNRRFDCSGSTSFVLLPVPHHPPLLMCSDHRKCTEPLNSPKSSRRTTPSTPRDRSPRQRPFAFSVAVPHADYHGSQPEKKVDRSTHSQKAVHNAIFSGCTRTSESTSSSCLSSSDTARTFTSSGPATPRVRSGGADSTSSGGGGDIACIADALRGKLERALSASLAEVRTSCGCMKWSCCLIRRGRGDRITLQLGID